ncbi:hypothetical protein LK994_13620 [Ferruginibacter lapsinanis]|uniref:hypothetical protein n=1 Tax=Ferruginibacter lapsinanis TaxID=563172 RepID=UPI001E56BED2|nr:hypothetical protein [Ferruginibacter lapsinanis]UEG49675.1 hypothetical protein LK994_13620 [Ferruginibacter lapsinanis]
MKANLVIIHLATIALNSLAGIIISDYKMMNMVYANLSIIFSLMVLKCLKSSSKNHRFYLLFFFMINLLGIVQFLCAVTFPNEVLDSMQFVILLATLTLQTAILVQASRI